MNSLSNFVEKATQLHVQKAAKPFSSTETDGLICIIAPIAQTKKVSEDFIKKMSWSEAIKKQLAKKLKNLDPEEKEKLNFDLRFDNGGICQFLFFNPKASPFEFHVALRETFGALLKQDWDSPVQLFLTDLPKALQSAALGDFVSLTALSQWESPKSSKKPKKLKERHIKTDVHTSLSSSEVNDISNRSIVVSDTNSLVRTLAEIAPNILNPKTYREFIEKRSQKLKYKTEFFDHKKLEKLGAGAFLAVARAAPENTGILHLWRPGKKGAKKLVLVGKGLCFDTGGYDIKTKHMFGMKNDMTGSAVALGIFEALLELEFKHEVHAYLALTENLISETAYKPNEVVTAMDGTTIEVVNTDAEGRMALADTLVLARKQKADLVLDFATLTGVAMYALDTKRSAIFGGPKNILSLAHEVGEDVGERNWSFPIGSDYKDGLKSQVADTLQCRVEGFGDHIYAATFLQNFVGEETPWVHMDLSACEHKGGLGLVGSNTTGFGVRWGVDFVTRFFKKK